MPCTSSAGAELARGRRAGAERREAARSGSLLSASALSGPGAGSEAGRRPEKLCQTFLAEPGAALGWPAGSGRGALARRTAGRGNPDRRELPRPPSSSLESGGALEPGSLNGCSDSTLSSPRSASPRSVRGEVGSVIGPFLARKRGEEPDRGAGEGEDACGDELDFCSGLLRSALEIQFDLTAAFAGEIESSPLLPASRRRCSPSSPLLLPLLLLRRWRPRSLGIESRRDGEDSPAPLCLGDDEVAAGMAEPRLLLVLLVELPSCRCRGECGRCRGDCGRLEPERSALRPGDEPPPDGGIGTVAERALCFVRRSAWMFQNFNFWSAAPCVRRFSPPKE